MKDFLDDFTVAEPWLIRTGFADPPAAHRNFIAIAERVVPLDLLTKLHEEIGNYMPYCADPDRALNNFERMLVNVYSPLSTITYHLRKPESLRVLLQFFATSQYFSDFLVDGRYIRNNRSWSV